MSEESTTPPAHGRPANRVVRDVLRNLARLQQIDQALGTSLLSTYGTTVVTVYGPLWRSYWRVTDRLVLVMGVLLAGVSIGVSAVFEVVDLSFPGGPALSSALRFLCLLLLILVGMLLVGFPGAAAMIWWQQGRAAEYFVFYRFMLALYYLRADDALDSKENRTKLLRVLNRAARSLSDLKTRADSAGEQIRSKSTRRFEEMSAKVLALEEQIIFPEPGALRSLRRTLVKYLGWAIERQYGMMPRVPVVPVQEVARGRIEGFLMWARNVLVASALALPFAFLAGWLTHWETDIDAIVSPGTAGELIGLILYGAVVLSVAAVVNPGVVRNIGTAADLVKTRK